MDSFITLSVRHHCTSLPLHRAINTNSNVLTNKEHHSNIDRLLYDIEASNHLSSDSSMPCRLNDLSTYCPLLFLFEPSPLPPATHYSPSKLFLCDASSRLQCSQCAIYRQSCNHNRCEKDRVWKLGSTSSNFCQRVRDDAPAEYYISLR